MERKRVRPEGTIETVESASKATSRAQAFLDRPYRDVLPFKKAHPALRTGLLSLSPPGTSPFRILPGFGLTHRPQAGSLRSFPAAWGVEVSGVSDLRATTISPILALLALGRKDRAVSDGEVRLLFA